MLLRSWRQLVFRRKFISPSTIRTLSSNSSTPWSRVSNDIATDPKSKKVKRITRKIQSAGTFIQVLEKELAESSAGALGRSQRVFDRAYDAFIQYREKNSKDSENVQCIYEHNELRKIALQKREELFIHRQCCGFRLNNDELIIKGYPIGAVWGIVEAPKIKQQPTMKYPNLVVPERAQSVPPSNYICNRCMVAGHWREDCPGRKG